MKLVAVEKVPGRRWHNKLQKMIEDFANSDLKIAEVKFEDGEYKSARVAVNVIGAACRRSKKPIKVHYRDGKVYLAKEI